ncbi:ribokinase [Spirosoma panaciterrae]|uniref:ribokinase n=1 Tax=Spirosoma panaciterrae TaxID=496058 RepID=UPI000374AFC8|nr:ribokinase [Spirosoma panaciterrae]
MPIPIIVIGSSNTDMVIKTSRLPVPGETIIGGTFLMNPGGKGANQAVAAARLGGQVTFVTNVGNDIFGQQAIRGFQQEGIDTRFVFQNDDHPTGVALITVDAQGENVITVAPGANAYLQPSDIDPMLDQIDPTSLVLTQLEIPMTTVAYITQQVAKRGGRVILNPAPAQSLPDRLLPSLYLISPNETEAKQLTGITVTDDASAHLAATQLHERGVQNVIITLGAKGAFLSEPGQSQVIAIQPVKAVDTTAAGDCFNGALTVALAEGKSLADAVAFACRAAGISVTRLGAQASMPKRTEL